MLHKLCNKLYLYICMVIKFCYINVFTVPSDLCVIMHLYWWNFILYGIAETVDKGELNAQFYYGTILHKNGTFDLCDLLPKVNRTCPVQPGMLLIQYNLSYPKPQLPEVKLTRL